jgi:hypothetical protein
MRDRGLIGDHYWIINGYGGEPDLEEQIKVAEQEIQDYKTKQQFAKDTWANECWAEQDKLYEFWLYKNMEHYWERVLTELKADGGTPPAEEVEIETEDLEHSGLTLKNDDNIYDELINKGIFINLTGEFPVPQQEQGERYSFA